MSAADDYNARQLAAGLLKPAHISKLVENWQRARSLDVDGKAGAKTLRDLESLMPMVINPQRVWPLRRLTDGRKPYITSAFRNPDRPLHSGVDIMFARKADDPPMKIGDGGRTAKWWIPENTLAIACLPGVVEWAGATATGFRCWIRDESGIALGYFHLRTMNVKAGDRVDLAQPLGIVSDNPKDHDPDHLHFEAARGSLDDLVHNRIDPMLVLEGATYLEAA